MKLINDRYSTRCPLVRTLLSVISIMFVLTACDQGNPSPPISPSFSLNQGKIYVQYNANTTTDAVSDSLAVFRADTGKFLWNAADYVDAPIADNTTVYIPTQTTLIARNVESGKERWRTSGPMVPNAVIDGILYAHSQSTSSQSSSASSIAFAAFQANDGRQLWTAKLSGYTVQHLEGDQGHIFVLTNAGFYVLQVYDGKLLWSVTTITFNSAFTSANGVIYLSRSYDNVLNALEASNGNRLWTFHAKDFSQSPPVLTSDGILCVKAGAGVTGEQGELYGLRAKDGVQLWKQPADFVNDSSQGTMVSANGVVYVASADKGLFAVQTKDGNDLWQFPQDAAIVDRDENSGIFYTISGSSVAAVGTDGRLLWKIPQQTDSQGYLASNGIVYQLIPGGLAGPSNEQRYPWADLTATRGRDDKSLWSKHLQF